MDIRRRREAPNSIYPAILLGAMMMLAGLGMLIMRALAASDSFIGMFHLQDGSCGIISRWMLVLGGFVILLYRRKGSYVAVGIYAMTLGFSRVIRSLPGITGNNNLNFYISLVFIAIGLNLIASGYNHLTVRTKNPTMMRFSVLIMISFYLIGIIYLYCNNIDIFLMISNTSDILWYFPLYVALILVLSTREILDNIPFGRIKRYSTGIADRLYMGDSVTISSEDAETIKQGLSDTSGWQERDVAGMSIREMKIIFRTETGDRDVILGKVEGKEGLAVSIVNDSRDSFVTGRRFRINGYSESDGVLELYDGKGVCAVLNIGGAE